MHIVDEEKRQRKLVYNRNLLREKRCKYLSERQHLLEELASLQEQLAAKQEAALLPWRDVVEGLKDECELQEHISKDLLRKYRTNKEVFRFLSKWANQPIAPEMVQQPIRMKESWRNVSLLHDPNVRRLGMDWITQQLFHNTDRMFQQHGIPATTDLNDFSVDGSNPESLSYVWRYQHEFDMSFEPFCDILRDTVQEFVMGSMWNSRFSCFLDESLLAHTQYARSIRSADEAVNYLVREFIGVDRAVFVGRNILEDESLPPSHRQSHRIFWYALERVSPTRTKLRILILKSQDFTQGGGNVSLDDEARYWGCDLSSCMDHLKLQTFRAHAATAGRSLLARGMFEMEMRMLDYHDDGTSSTASSTNQDGGAASP
ncbi:Aste57867_11821 [Aphanomyces stellatus]|uniref:Aste57867_11821 protein n=1 Tax=Aphanomyces stellatus TaxID=120398 RepID=A0A485KU03_9STRA|nr:hypothetical protein As57867_011776 [Aphanomyces stellatus]VFT88676.1 Aste57867_11821 [Aphanomyces stellatus]